MPTARGAARSRSISPGPGRPARRTDSVPHRDPERPSGRGRYFSLATILAGGLHASARRWRRPVGPAEVPALDDATQGDSADTRPGRHGADRPAAGAVDRNSPTVRSTPGLAIGAVEQPGQPRAARRSLRLAITRSPVRRVAGLQPDRRGRRRSRSRLDDQPCPRGRRWSSKYRSSSSSPAACISRGVASTASGPQAGRAERAAGGGQRFRAHADHPAPTAAGQAARRRGHLVAFLRRPPRISDTMATTTPCPPWAYLVEQLLQGRVVDPSRRRPGSGRPRPAWPGPAWPPAGSPRPGMLLDPARTRRPGGPGGRPAG